VPEPGGLAPGITRQVIAARFAAIVQHSPPLLLLLLSLTFGLLLEAQGHERTRRGLTFTAQRPLVAYLVLRSEDCEAHLELLRHLERPGIARSTEIGGALLLGSTHAAQPAMALIARELPNVPARSATRSERRLFMQHGYRRTPVLLVLESASGAVRFASRVPLTPRERVRFLAALSAVTTL
jgi:hypothetical protein